MRMLLQLIDDKFRLGIENINLKTDIVQLKLEILNLKLEQMKKEKEVKLKGDGICSPGEL